MLWSHVGYILVLTNLIIWNLMFNINYDIISPKYPWIFCKKMKKKETFFK